MSTPKEYVQGKQYEFHSMIIRDKQNLCVGHSHFLILSSSKSIYIQNMWLQNNIGEIFMFDSWFQI